MRCASAALTTCIRCLYMYITVYSYSSICVCLTSDFAVSGLFAALIIAVLFFWHTQHRSLIGFLTIMVGISCLHRAIKVV